MKTKKVNAHTAKAAEFIRYRILSGDYPAGFRLKTIDLAAESGVSRTPVREALRQLHQEGLVDLRPRQGARVRIINFKDFKEMCGLRLAMESFAAELAATNRSPEQLVEMEDALQQMERIVVKLSDGPDSEALSLELAKEDIHFHLAILNASGNGLLRQEVLRVHLLNKLVNVNLLKLNLGSEINDNKFVMDIERRKYVQSCHRKIYEAILSGESEAARLAMYQHLKEIIDRSMILVARRERNREGNAPLGADALGASV